MSSKDKGVPFDPVDLTVLGDVGQSGKPVNDEVRDIIKRAFLETTDPSSNGKASITIKIDVKRVGSESVTVHHDVRYTAPKKERLSMVAHFDHETNQVVTQDHRQLELDGDRVVSLKNKEGGNAR